MKFEIKIDAKFDAENIEDAFLKLSRHFKRLYNGEDLELEFIGEIEIAPCKKQNAVRP